MHSSPQAVAKASLPGRDLVVVLPGIMGSSLEDRDGHELWGLGAGGILTAIRTLGRSIRSLTLSPDVGDGPAEDGVRPRSLLGGLHVIPGLWSPIQGYSALVRFLAEKRFGLFEETPDRPGNLILFPYDWRLSNRYNAELLKKRVETALPRWQESHPERKDARVIFVTHSMGGLIARWYIEQGGGVEVVRSLITLGTPHRGAVKALAQLVNGIGKGFGPLRIDLTSFARSLPSSYELLPEYACIETSAGEQKKTTEVTIPHLDPARIRAGMEFYERLNAGSLDYDLIPVIGIGQPTLAAGSLNGERIEASNSFAGREVGGDGTVVRFSAHPFQMKAGNPVIRGVGDGHGALTGNEGVLDQLDWLLTVEEVVYRAAAPERSQREVIGLDVADLHLAGEPVEVKVHAMPQVLEIVAVDERLRQASSELVQFGDDVDEDDRAIGKASIQGLPPGAYTLIARAPGDPGNLRVPPAHALILVYEVPA